jgi:hypothetical protein
MQILSQFWVKTILFTIPCAAPVVTPKWPGSIPLRAENAAGARKSACAANATLAAPKSLS